MIAVYVMVGVFAVIGLLVTVIVLLIAASVALDVRRDRRRLRLKRLADPTFQPDLDDPSSDGRVVAIPTRPRRAP